MPKRKAEGPPEFYAILEVNDSEPNLDQGGLTTEQKVTPECPTGAGCHKEPADDHLSPALSEVDEGSVPDYSSFWSLLSLAGYETW